MSVEQSILATIKTDLAKITTGNGYNFTFAGAYNGDLTNAENNTDKKPYFVLGDTNTGADANESYAFSRNASMTLKILVKFKAENTDEAVSTETEKIINDLRRWKNLDCTIGTVTGVDHLMITRLHRPINFSEGATEAGISIIIYYQTEV